MKVKTLSLITLAISFFSLSCSSGTSSSEGESLCSVEVGAPIRLYEGKAPGSEDTPENEGVEIEWNGEKILVSVSSPTITPFIPKGKYRTDACVIVLPGGGFRMLSIDKEGANIARWYAEHGITAFLLKYRTTYFGDSIGEAGANISAAFNVGTGQASSKDGYGSGDRSVDVSSSILAGSQKYISLAADDLRQAIKLVREKAQTFEVNPGKVAVNGCSAGCRTSLNVLFDHDRVSRPDLIVALYGNTDAGEMPEDPMPIIFIAPENDIYGVPTAFEIYRMWQSRGIPSEMHYFAGANHGFGLLPDDDPVHKWPGLVLDFMKKTGFLD